MVPLKSDSSSSIISLKRLSINLLSAGFKLKAMILMFAVFSFSACSSDESQPESTTESHHPEMHRAMNNFPNFDLQGHRGARGLLPENTIPSLLIALDYPITTLEFDVVVSADSQIVLSHEPWFHHHISTDPDGNAVTPEEAPNHNMFRMTYEEITRFDVGKRGHVNFPEQQPMEAVKPLMKEAIQAVEEHISESGRAQVFYNIETKSRPEWDNVYHPEPMHFAQLLYDELRELDMLDRVFIQSFDVRTLQAMREIDDTIPLVLLVENRQGYDWNIEQLGFIPQIYSPSFTLIDETTVERVKADGMKLVPWTLNEKDDMRRLVELGVDGIITDYPNSAAELDEIISRLE